MAYNRSQINENFFTEINTEEKAYFLGLIFADGSISKVKSGNRQMVLSLCLQEGDYKVVERLNNIITPYKTFNFQHPPSVKSRGWKARAQFTVSSDKICQELISLGCNIRKSENGVKAPRLKKGLGRHFVRGYFDGNGGISIKLKEYSYTRVSDRILTKVPKKFYVRPSIYVMSTDLKFLNAIKRFIVHECDIQCKVQEYSRKSKNLITHRIVIEDNREVKKISDFLYKDASVYLNRKKEKFDTIISSEAESTLSERSTTT